MVNKNKVSPLQKSDEKWSNIKYRKGNKINKLLTICSFHECQQPAFPYDILNSNPSQFFWSKLNYCLQPCSRAKPLRIKMI